MKMLEGNRKQGRKAIKNDQDAVFAMWPAKVLLTRSHSCMGSKPHAPLGLPHPRQKGQQVQRPCDGGESS